MPLPHNGRSLRSARRSPPRRAHRFDNSDRGLDTGFDIEIRIVENMRILGAFQRCRSPVLVALVAPEDIGQYGGLVGVPAPPPRLQGAAAGPNLWGANAQELHAA